jgi:hypothetical protein
MDACPQCGASIGWASERCVSCGRDIGFPNVRAASAPTEVDALEQRFKQSEAKAQESNLSPEFCDLLDLAARSSGVVVSMPAEAALNLVTNESSQYASYEGLVGSEARAPAAFANDSHRQVVAGALFGVYGTEIRYGALSLGARGLATYGDLYCRLKQIAVQERTSFLECNSYDFLKRFGTENHPPGYRSDWRNRGKLIVVKLQQSGLLRSGYQSEDWERSLLISDGKNRLRDEFIEAHIFGPFNVYSIEQIVPAEPIRKGKEKLVELVVNTFEAIRTAKG